MANRRFIDFPIATTVGANDIILIWQDGLNKQTTKATILSGLPEDLEDLADVNISGLTNGQILRYDSTTGKWVNTDQGNLDLNDLNDVSIVSPSNGQVLVYNSSTSKWENSSAGFVPYTGAVTTVNLGAQTIQAGSFVKAGGTSAQFLKADGSVDSNTYGAGTVTSVGLTMPAAFSVANSPVTTAGTLAVTGAGTTSQYIQGDGTLATFPALTGFVPYTGATADVNLGTHDLAAERGTFENNGSSNTLTVNHTSGSGYGIIVTKGGNNEALYVSKTSGSGNAMTVVGGRTSLVDLALSSVTNTAGDFLTISGGVVHKRTAAEVRTDIGAGTGNGTVTSVAALTLGTSGTDLSSTVANGTTTPVITLNVPTASATNRGALSAADWSTFNSKASTADLANYLPLAGGTLTGALNGTSASFSSFGRFGGSNIGTNFAVNMGANTSIYFNEIDSATAELSAVNNTNTAVKILRLQAPGGATQVGGTLAVTGDATFTNTITAGALSRIGNVFIAGRTGTYVTYSDGIFGDNLHLGATGTGGAVYINTALNRNFIVNPVGGNLLVGTTTDAGARLQVNGNATISGNATIGNLSSGSDAIVNFATNASGGFRSIIYRAATAFMDFTNTAGTAVFQLSNGGAATFLSTLDAIDSIKVTNNNTSFFSASRFQLAAHNGTSVVIGGLIFQTSSASIYGEILGNQTNIYGSAANGIRMATATAPIIFATGNADTDFSTARMTITSGGNVLIANAGQTNGALVVGRNGNDNSILAVSDANNTSEAYFKGYSTAVSATRIIIYSNGNIVNSNNSYGAISDIKLKENIFDASDKLQDLLNVKVRNFNYIGNNQKQIGVIAQELEEIFPSLIDVDTKTNTKSVKYSVFVPMLIKAIQELKQEIDTLKN
jgi:hypothetical protein